VEFHIWAQVKSEGFIVRGRLESFRQIRLRVKFIVLARKPVEDQLPHSLSGGIRTDARIERLYPLFEYNNHLALFVRFPTGWR
jgi:hypothetical protein